MGRIGRLALAVLALAVLLLVSGCGAGDSSGEVLPLKVWTLETPLGVSEVTLPAHVNDRLPSGPSRYVLRTHVVLTPGFQGRPLTLAMAHLPAIVTLRVNGFEAVALDTSPFDRYRGSGPHRWRITSEDTRGASLDLEMTVEHRWVQSGWIEWVPRLSATPAGDPQFLFVTAFNTVTAVSALATVLLVSFLYGVLYLFDRSRTVNLWHTLQGVFAAFYPALLLGLLQPIAGTADVPLAAIGVTAAAICSVYFVSGIFGEPRPHPAWWLLLCAVTVAALLSGGPFETSTAVAPIVVTAVAGASIHGVVTLLRARKTGRPSLPKMLASLGFPLSMVFGLPDACAILGIGDWAAGLRGAPLSMAVLSMLQALALSRGHIESLLHADDLNVQLAARVALLESNNQEIRVLNDELRRQVAARSQRLVEALSRIGAFPARVKAFALGDVIDERYRVIRHLGEGGMGTVYEVERLVDARRLALKVLQGHRSGADLARLAREAQIASQLDHPNVVKMFDVDVSTSGAVFVVMEYVDGASLDDLTARYGDVAWALGLLHPIAEGLAAMHAEEIVHRDLKPGNVLVARGAAGAELVKIADFGIAMHAGSVDETTGPTDNVFDLRSAERLERDRTDPSLTRTGQVLGTPLYMAPELVLGAKYASAASDVYALGVMAFQLITGEVPSGYEALAHLRDRTAEVPSLAAHVTSLPTRLASVLDRCLSRDPAARPTAREVADALTQGMAGAGGRIEAARGIPAA